MKGRQIIIAMAYWKYNNGNGENETDINGKYMSFCEGVKLINTSESVCYQILLNS